MKFSIFNYFAKSIVHIFYMLSLIFAYDSKSNTAPIIVSSVSGLLGILVFAVVAKLVMRGSPPNNKVEPNKTENKIEFPAEKHPSKKNTHKKSNSLLFSAGSQDSIKRYFDLKEGNIQGQEMVQQDFNLKAENIKEKKHQKSKSDFTKLPKDINTNQPDILKEKSPTFMSFTQYLPDAEQNDNKKSSDIALVKSFEDIIQNINPEKIEKADNENQFLKISNEVENSFHDYQQLIINEEKLNNINNKIQKNQDNDVDLKSQKKTTLSMLTKSNTENLNFFIEKLAVINNSIKQNDHEYNFLKKEQQQLLGLKGTSILNLQKIETQNSFSLKSNNQSIDGTNIQIKSFQSNQSKQSIDLGEYIDKSRAKQYTRHKKEKSAQDHLKNLRNLVSSTAELQNKSLLNILPIDSNKKKEMEEFYNKYPKITENSKLRQFQKDSETREKNIMDRSFFIAKPNQALNNKSFYIPKNQNLSPLEKNKIKEDLKDFKEKQNLKKIPQTNLLKMPQTNLLNLDQFGPRYSVSSQSNNPLEIKKNEQPSEQTSREQESFNFNDSKELKEAQQFFQEVPIDKKINNISQQKFDKLTKPKINQEDKYQNLLRGIFKNSTKNPKLCTATNLQEQSTNLFTQETATFDQEYKNTSSEGELNSMEENVNNQNFIDYSQKEEDKKLISTITHEEKMGDSSKNKQELPPIDELHQIEKLPKKPMNFMQKNKRNIKKRIQIEIPEDNSNQQNHHPKTPKQTPGFCTEQPKIFTSPKKNIGLKQYQEAADTSLKKLRENSKFNSLNTAAFSPKTLSNQKKTMQKNLSQASLMHIQPFQKKIQQSPSQANLDTKSALLDATGKQVIVDELTQIKSALLSPKKDPKKNILDQFKDPKTISGKKKNN